MIRTSRRHQFTNKFYFLHTSFWGFFSDLNVQIQALNQVLDALDHQLDNIVEEIIRIRIPGRHSFIAAVCLQLNTPIL